MPYPSIGSPRSRSFVVVLALALVAVARPALADSAADFKEALALFEQERCDQALPKFEAVVAETGSPNARIYVARCLKNEGRLDEAYEQMRQTVSDATQRAETEDKYVPTRDSAAAELALLEPKVAKLVVAVVEPPDGTVVYIGTRALSGEQLGVPVAVMPGTLDVRAEAPGRAPVLREVELAAGKTRTITLTMDEAAPEAEVSDQIPDEPTGSTSSMGGIRITGFVVAGLGVAGLAVGAGLAAKAQSDFDALDEECQSMTCPEGEQGRVDDGRMLTTVANASLIVGGILAAGGAAMIIFGGNDDDGDASATLEIAPILGPTTNGLTFSGRF